MSDFRRYFVAGGTYFFTIVTYCRRPILASDERITLLRRAIATVKRELPFDINAAVILPDHIHFLLTMPPGDDNYSKRIGRIKVEFTRAFRNTIKSPRQVSISRKRRNESDVWQRRFWEHLIRDDGDFDRHFDYIHYNPVKHGRVKCPHAWTATSFHHWVKRGVYDQGWACNCGARRIKSLDFSDIETSIRERDGERCPPYNYAAARRDLMVGGAHPTAVIGRRITPSSSSTAPRMWVMYSVIE